MVDMQIRVNTTASGPLFDGRAARAAAQFRDEVQYRVATEAEDMLHARLQQVLQHPTGYYESRIQVSRAGAGYRVHDSNVVYGPWLAGTGSRNYPVTRFRGYDHWKRTKALIARRGPGIARAMVHRLARRM